MTVRYFYSTDTGAPTIDNQLGDLCNVLDACLVTGFPTQAVESITRSGSTATVTITGHGYSNGQILSISGADEDEYNGNFQIFNVGTDTFDYTVTGTPSTPANGSNILASNGKTALGWQLVFSATNKRVYRAREGNRMYLRVDHSVNTYHARIRGFETMSDVDNGTGLFPTDAQLSGGLVMKSTENSGTNHPWMLIGDERMFYSHVQTHATAAEHNTTYFGDVLSFKPVDPYAVLIAAHTTTGTSGSGDPFINLNTSLATTTAGHYMPRSHSGMGGSIQVSKMSDFNRHISTALGNGTPGTNVLTYPCPVDGGLHLCRVFVNEPGSSGGLRGLLRGLWNVCHNKGSMTGVVDHDTFNGSGGLTGKTFEWRIFGQNNCCGAYEISDTWEPWPT